jgi:hypothetical protein
LREQKKGGIAMGKKTTGSNTDKKQALELEITNVLLSGMNLRKDFGSTKAKNGLVDLTENIRVRGLIEPIVVMAVADLPDHIVKVAMRYTKKVFGKVNKDATHVVVCGERRTWAINSMWDDFRKNRGKINAIQVSYSGEIDLMCMMSSENLARKGLNPIEALISFQEIKKLMEKSLKRPITTKELAKVAGYNASYVGSIMALVKMPQDIQDAIRDGTINPVDANFLNRIKNPEEREYLITKKGTMKDGDWRKELAEKAPKIATPENVCEVVAQEINRNRKSAPPPPAEPIREEPIVHIRPGPLDMYGNLGRPRTCCCLDCDVTNERCGMKPRPIKS